MKWATQRGFTIVELLIVIVVIAILAAITIVAFNGIQQRGRDGQRMSEVGNIKKAIEMYKVDNGTYPAACASDDAGCSASNLSTYLSIYMRSVPQDPQAPSKRYDYVRGPVANNSYAILVHRELNGDCKTGSNVNMGWWGAGVPLC